MMPAHALAALERIQHAYGAGRAARKLAMLTRLARARLRSAGQVLRLHEVLAFLRAYPDDARVLAQARRMLANFARRADLRAHREALESSGVAGTAIRHAYFWPTLRWVARRWPKRLVIDREDHAAARALEASLALLLTSAEAEWVRERRPGGFDALEWLRPRGVSDAVFLAHLIEALPGDGRTREAFHDAIEPFYVLRPGPGTPSRSTAHHATGPVAYQRSPLRRARPDLRAEARRAPRAIQALDARRGARLIDLARAAMLTRERDLDAFAYGEPRDVRLVHDDGGLAFALIGVVPERRAPVAAIFGALTLHNGVPIGYVQFDVCGRSAALSYNVFETFRSAEAAHVFGRALALAHHVFGVDAFSIEPYQLGEDNDEAIESGAWWFYAKLGFRPRSAEGRRLARRELARAARRGYRSGEATLRALARHHLFLELEPDRPCPLPPLAALGARVSRVLAARHSQRAAAIEACSAQALAATGLRSLRGFDTAERLAWRRWAPLILALRAARWPGAERRALIEVVRAKAARSELAYVRRFAAHPRLARALLRQVR
jgi:hypothetical protein